ncbi:hypothetical protein GCM10010329_05760 [Streptomyces spiroverticillatus]|uniref:Uncharacterized protein n=1 Tax=Streptomyces finlayi TaxID=67296 RepID=A0A919C6Y5_9ACTN|nr:hypothetical protein [Streptomyces finlayi]GGZ88474.1 hypothetical protein GCM10010329_05760 [Streptomyces spiroverticillatus]GHC79481.1 hypothetical protein GCM10010334_05740 [Streptomyces finlayi]
MTSANLFLLILGLAALACGVWIALTAPARARQALQNAELRASAQFEMVTAPSPFQTPTTFRVLGSVVAAGGALLALLGTLT